MTRFLSESLSALEPRFGSGLHSLEAAHGRSGVDIRFSLEAEQATKRKISELELDPEDTTAEELYHALNLRLKIDDYLLTRRLRTLAATKISSEADPVDGIIEAIKSLPESKSCFAIKSASLKSLLSELPPKKAMKTLGYRSLASMLKHEQPSLVMMSAGLVEAKTWHERFLNAYSKLTSSDFETRDIQLLKLPKAHWQGLKKRDLSVPAHNILSFRETGTLIFLPLSDNAPEGSVTACLSLALHELNEIRVCSSFLKLAQLRGDFGKAVALVATEDEATLNMDMLGKKVPWRILQRHYSDANERFKEALFEPNLRLEDMVWHPIEKSLAAIEPRLEFWHGTPHLGINERGRPVSLNILDSAINLCNKLPFEQRISSYFQASLWHDLMLKYLRHEPVERQLETALQPEEVTDL